jgi:hypothetical protein
MVFVNIPMITFSDPIQGQATQIPDIFYRTENTAIIKMGWIQKSPSENEHLDWRNALSIKKCFISITKNVIELELDLLQKLEIIKLILLNSTNADPVAMWSEARSLSARTLDCRFKFHLSLSVYVVLSCVGRGLATS